ncbi:MAG: 4-hydroxy-tetrahydrodipicolinate reductase [Chloroflexota bacterium]|nr:4-hydroxy-tetrahydrodipicolinate reductase [Chloroflexota bacterium]
MEPVKVVVSGGAGKMGQELLRFLATDPELLIVGALDRAPAVTRDTITIPGSTGVVPFSSDADALFTRVRPQVWVDFSHAEFTMPVARAAVRQHVNLVIGTTGLSQENMAEIERLCRSQEVGAVIASNFALGAVVMIHLAKVAARFFDYAEILEMHHEQKADAPSGTALTTAKEMVAARGRPFAYAPTQKFTVPGTRGGQWEGVGLHSLRTPGLLAHQEIVLGSLGQTLRIRHDTISRECYIPGVSRAIKEVIRLKRPVFGLGALLGL